MAARCSRYGRGLSISRRERGEGEISCPEQAEISEASPSPSGRRWREAPDEGKTAETFRYDCPHPALRATLSRRERNLAQAGFQFANPLEHTSSVIAEKKAVQGH